MGRPWGQAANREEDMVLFGQKHHQEDLVFVRTDGTPLRPDSVSHAFRKLAIEAGMEGLRFHDLRHTHASLLVAAGVHLKVVSERLGHSSVAITGDLDSHVLPGLQEELQRNWTKI